ncbi:hypothetical protein PybrP1_006529, partial [[Pythium] brassicae (nom. inval.)]
MELKLQNRDEPVMTPKDDEIIETRFTTAEEDLAEEEYKNKSLGEKIFWGVFYTIFALASLYFFMVAVKLI